MTVLSSSALPFPTLLQFIVECHGNTLLPQFLGMYRLTVDGVETYMVVTRNVFSHRLTVHRKYDLKVRVWRAVVELSSFSRGVGGGLCDTHFTRSWALGFVQGNQVLGAVDRASPGAQMLFHSPNTSGLCYTKETHKCTLGVKKGLRTDVKATSVIFLHEGIKWR